MESLDLFDDPDRHVFSIHIRGPCLSTGSLRQEPRERLQDPFMVLQGDLSVAGPCSVRRRGNMIRASSGSRSPFDSRYSPSNGYRKV